MNRNFVLIGLLIVLAGGTLSAQRSFTASYDSARKVTLEGPITKIDWVNPRAFLFMNVRDAQGAISNWAVEFGNPNLYRSESQLLVGTDYPFNFHDRTPVQRIEAAGFDAETTALLVHRNAGRFLARQKETT